jgi:1-deoxy-D-xylulose-5-phosphate synthase
MFYTALGHDDGPVAIRYPRDSGSGIAFDEEWEPVPWGKGEVLREGDDLAIIAYGTMSAVAMEAAAKLELEGMRATVVNARFAKPLDEELLCELATRLGTLVTIEEGQLMGGFGSALLELLETRGIDARVHRLGIPDRFVEHGTRDECLSAVGLTADQVTESISAWMRTTSHV